MKIRKAVIPAAGFGTRFLPQTKAMPKEMMPVVDKPVIQYIVEDLVAAGIEQIIIVTGSSKRAIEDHFDNNYDLEETLRISGKLEMLEEVRRISSMADFVYVRQKGPLGNGTPIVNVKHVVGNEPFYMCWGDEILVSDPPFVTQLIGTYQKYSCTILGCLENKSEADAMKYGFAKGHEVEPGVMKLDLIDEKPGKSGRKAPSDYAQMGGIVFTPSIFGAMEEAMSMLKENQELYYTEGVNILMKSEVVYAKKVVGGRHYDCGDKLSYLETVVEYGLHHPELNGDFKAYLKTLNLD